MMTKRQYTIVVRQSAERRDVEGWWHATPQDDRVVTLRGIDSLRAAKRRAQVLLAAMPARQPASEYAYPAERALEHCAEISRSGVAVVNLRK